MNFTQSFQNMMDSVVAFVPRALAFLAILIIGWIVAKVIGRLIGKLLHKVGLDRVGERSGLRRFTGKFELSDLLGKVVYYMLLLFTLQLAFGAFGNNPVSTLLNQLVAWLPLLFVALVIVVVAFAIANAVYSLVNGMLSDTSYGKTVARICQVAIVFFGAVAAFGQVGIATTVTTPIMWTVLAIVAGVTIVGVGGGLITPMRQRWEKMLNTAESEAGKMKEKQQSQSTDATKSMSRTYASERYGAETNTQVREPMPPTGTPASSPAAPTTGEAGMGERGARRGRGEGTQGRIDPTTR
ncbi:mechanosensitive ion channel family protein [Glycomyces albidus]|uniref:Uncharacterized protein n=1 Tax=Glycomyces albidus TaxID=2656774 RepID=A0A6L5GGX6_9ACTN|nr:hypothetical protein [Glycomyces albidus]MQM28984.1 hypothetical protein [Glycomyces albidus]